MSFHHPAQAFHTELCRILIQQYYHCFNYFANSDLTIIITTIWCMSQKVWGFMHQTASPTCIKARQSLSKWDESLLRRSFARFRLKVNSSTFQVIFFKFYEYLWLYLYVFSILFLWLYEWLVSTFYKTKRCKPKLCFKYIELLFLTCKIIFREKRASGKPQWSCPHLYQPPWELCRAWQ